MSDSGLREESRFVYDQSPIPSSYDKGRQLTPSAIELLRVNLSHYLQDKINGICDLGCGTGRFTFLLSEWFRTRVFGVDPSHEMLQTAKLKLKKSDCVDFIIGSAESIPLTSPISMIFMSNVLHHVEKLDIFISEAIRILQPDGYLVIRTMVRDHIGIEPMFRFFPTAGKIESARVFSISEVEEKFTSSGFSLVASTHLKQEAAKSLLEYLPIIEARAVSVLHLISDSDFISGVENARNSVGKTEFTGPIVENLQLFIFKINKF